MLALVLTVFAAGLLPAAATGTAGSDTLTILDVPFLSQSEQLCGGAAAAMVLRYWGARDVFAEDFAPLVDASLAGIRGVTLTEALRRRGWNARSLRGNRAVAQAHLARGRPLIALIEDRPGRYHYVVVVAWPDGRVILHDPARAPFRVLPESTFVAAWAATNFWTLLVLPDPDTPPGDAPLEVSEASAPSPFSESCSALVQQGVRLAQSGDRDAADAALSAAVEQCPASAPAARELAGLRFVQSRWQEAAQLAARATTFAPDDVHAWRLLATSRFVQNDIDGALKAWNRIGEPRIDVVRIEGLDHTGHAIVEGLLGLAPRSELTAMKLRRARRRLAMLPLVSASRVGYRPIPGGLAEVDAVIVEQSQFPKRPGIVGFAAHALTEHEFLLDVAAPGGGTRSIVGWRWWEARPRVSLSLVAPAAFGRSGLWRFDGFWEQQSYAVSERAGDEALTREDRKRLALSYANWTGADTRVALGVALDRWDRSRPYVAMSGSLDQRLVGDRLAAAIRGAFWPALDRGARFGSGEFDLAWRSSSTSGRQPLLTSRAGLESASARAPFGIWPGADIGHARDALARAHPLLDQGVIAGRIFGRTLAHGTVELQAKTPARGPAQLSIAFFGDVARSWHSLQPTVGDRTQIDVGVGLRARIAGQSRTLRIDVAHGVRDGRTVISAGWQLPWPE